MNSGATAVIISLATLVLFVLLTLFELWALRKLGFDVLAQLEYSQEHEKKGKFLFKAFGAVAFVMVQPVIFLMIMTRLIPAINATLDGAARVLF